MVVLQYSSPAADLYNVNVRCGLAARKKLKRQETLKAVEFEPRKIRNDTLRIDAGDATEATQDKILSLDAKLTFLNTRRLL